MVETRCFDPLQRLALCLELPPSFRINGAGSASHLDRKPLLSKLDLPKDTLRSGRNNCSLSEIRYLHTLEALPPKQLLVHIFMCHSSIRYEYISNGVARGKACPLDQPHNQCLVEQITLPRGQAALKSLLRT